MRKRGVLLLCILLTLAVLLGPVTVVANNSRDSNFVSEDEARYVAP